MRRYLYLLIITLLLITGCQQEKHPTTWSIVAADPTTGEVGIAAASCVPIPLDALAALVPGKGVATTQAAFTIENRNHVFDLIKQDESAENIVDTVTSADADAAIRQYGVITMDNGEATIASFTGDENGDWAGDKQANGTFAVTVQGNVLAGEAVLADALAAFNDASLGDVHLSDRLMRALEAGSAAGGDERCNLVAQQTAAAAVIIVAQGEEAPFAAKDIGETENISGDAPSLQLSVSNPIGTANPIIELREQYDQWRGVNLEPCVDCDLSSITVPEGGGSFSRIINLLNRYALIWIPLTLLGILIWLLRRWWRKRKSEK